MRTLNRPSRPRRALTLIELLAVILIVSLAAGAALIRLGPVTEHAALRSAALALQELDGRARLHALRGERITMELDHLDHAAREVRLVATGSREVVGREALPKGASLRIRSGGGAVTTLVFDRSGRSADYAAELERDGHRIAWRIGGATGLVLAEEFDP